jgi:POT family proton-dependent oligopeptide transporter
MNSVKNQTFLGHPKGLYVLFFSEMWERFCYYGMRGLLVLYITKSLMEGDARAFAIYGAFTGLVYMAPVLGGLIADKILGYKMAVVFGGIMMAIGEFMILGGGINWLYIGMATIIVGNGYFKANISSIVGKLYDDQDVRKDSGFTIFYIGINLGALLATLVAVWVGETYGFKYGFGLAGFGMLLGLLIFLGGKRWYEFVALPPDRDDLHKKVFGPITKLHATIILSILLIPFLYFIIQYNDYVGYLLMIVAVYIIIKLLRAGIAGGKVLTHRMIIFIILALFNIIFWSLFEQAGSSLTLFADRNVDRNLLGFWDMTAGQTQFFNPFFILTMGSIFSWMWIQLDKRKINPNIPAKFGIGILLVGVGFYMTTLGKAASVDYMVPIWTLILLYFFHTVGELFLSPIGLSMVTKLAPSDMTGTLMGAWFLSFAGANYVAGSVLAPLTGTGGEGEGGVEVVLTSAESLTKYVDIFTQFAWIGIIAGLVILVLSPLLNKLMHGIK